MVFLTLSMHSSVPNVIKPKPLGLPVTASYFILTSITFPNLLKYSRTSSVQGRKHQKDGVEQVKKSKSEKASEKERESQKASEKE